MNEVIMQLGVGGIFAIIVIKTVLEFVKDRRNNNPENSNGFVSRKEFNQHRQSVQYRDNCEQIQRTINAKFDGMAKLDEERAQWQSEQFKKIDGQFSEVKRMIGELK